MCVVLHPPGSIVASSSKDAVNKVCCPGGGDGVGRAGLLIFHLP